MKQRKVDDLDSLLADDVRFSPIAETSLQGKQATLPYLSGAFKVFFNESFHYLREYTDPHGAEPEYEVEVNGIAVNRVDIMTWNDNGELFLFQVIHRPLSAINQINKHMNQILRPDEK